MTPDEFTAALDAALISTPPMAVQEERLPDGSLALKMSGAEPPYADGGTLIVPAAFFNDGGPVSAG